MGEKGFELPVTLRQIVRQDRDYFRQIAPEMDWRDARIRLWRSHEQSRLSVRTAGQGAGPIPSSRA